MSDTDQPTPIARPNVYGPDQAHELATHAVVWSDAPEATGARVPAGRPIRPDMTKYVIDKSVANRIQRRRWF